AMWNAIGSARRGDFRAHRRYSVHVLLQLGVAVVSRVLLAGAEQLGVYGTWVYVSALWLPVLLSALVAELSTASRSVSLMKGARHEPLVAVSRLALLRQR